MAYDFPNAPSIGQVANGYVWDGEKWMTLGSPSAPVMRTDALGWSGMQINGSMNVSQENGAAAVVFVGTGNRYVLDGWSLETAGGPTYTGFPYASGSGLPSLPAFVNISANAAVTTPVAGDYVLFKQNIEGYRWSRLGWGAASGNSVTIGFWISVDRAGTFSLSLRNNAADRSYCVPFVMTTTAQWQYKTVTIPPCPDGTWLSTNGIGVRLGFCFAAGATHVAPSANAWVSGGGGYLAAPGQTSMFPNASGVAITGVVVLPGIEAPTAAQSPLIMRPYDQELLTCQRYYWKFNAGAMLCMGNVQGTTTVAGVVHFPVTLRTGPTVAASGSWSFNMSGAMTPITSIGANTPYLNTAQIFGTITALTQGMAGRIMGTDGTAVFTADARL